ncbi:Polyadenylate-binding protein, putative [Perkinsus marinus ATCC 50983]|uniref:Polyadenylate-binding protein, putative n=2 Tax=Perkinsus marinus (strain ATCC 50983 / TXsc) TaxID=423536 RepID=C5LD77_PERM5|nr:Polyadenylate-binding protein, putative [Perkinsus marinus ATCC 50983]EER05209.1 Polyadenylate-binding protein, putative [Perkinsus marinus ATCC 50983]|eukprot:XP_002773393.1 Polyadenylate-binding protein, putative [Perkinsus marinus ATCC 50983]
MSETEKEETEEKKVEETDEGKPTATKQYKVFVGNMSYNTTQDALKHFFKCVKDELSSIRLLTDKKSNQSRGCAFVEFSGPGAMKKALAMTGSELNGRKLRIEPSAAGGGKSTKRMQRINRNKKVVEREIKKKRKVWAAKKKTEKESADVHKTST